MLDEPPHQWTVAQGVELANEQIASVETREKRPLYRDLPPAPSFPIKALGPLQDAAVAIQAFTQAPMAIAGQSVLAAATLAAQAQRDVYLPAGGRKPISGLFITVAESGERKSSVDRLALAGVYEAEREWREKTATEWAEYENSREAWETIRAKTKKSFKGSAEDLKAELSSIGAEPKSPPHPMLLIADPTPEALVLHLAEGRSFAGVFTAEGGLIIGGAAFSDESKMRSAALFNTLWDAEPIRRKRVGTGSSYLPGRRCSVHIMLQPVIANDLLGNSLFDDIGLTARMLMVAPASTAGTRLFREPPPTAHSALKLYNDKIRNLLMRETVVNPNMPDVLDPPPMQLSSEARSAWITFHDQCEMAVCPGGDLSRIKAFAGKLPEHAGRLAAVLTICDNPEALEVPVQAMDCGIQLASHYALEALRLADGASVPQELRSAQKCLTWLQSRSDIGFHLSFVYQFGPNCVRNASSARETLKILVDHGHIEKLKTGSVVDGAPRKEAWRLVP